MLYQRLELHLDEETQRQLEARAARNNQAVEALCVDIIREYLKTTGAPNGATGDNQDLGGHTSGQIELDPVVAQRAEQDVLIGALLDWMNDDSGYDEATWPVVKQALENNRLSSRSRFNE